MLYFLRLPLGIRTKSIVLISLQIPDMPGLLLLAKQYISFSFFDLFKDLIIACSLAPDPITKIFTMILKRG